MVEERLPLEDLLVCESNAMPASKHSGQDLGCHIAQAASLRLDRNPFLEGVDLQVEDLTSADDSSE